MMAVTFHGLYIFYHAYRTHRNLIGGVLAGLLVVSDPLGALLYVLLLHKVLRVSLNAGPNLLTNAHKMNSRNI